ncbi:P-loop NTPase fold protein [uncultured Frigoribacterium sp.]|uniref:P-loop NTPase fold protein n=1 Tax=uncultured Frigoribacterium sp. TaxID=335377 RepID=UPI0028CFF3A2|nr:P-loop NTPase fold protein [uncultured Frigoribacterium sp.]
MSQNETMSHMPNEARESTPWFFSDVPVSTESHDSFGHRDLANNLETAIRSNRGRVMIGLLGGFGVGKSSVIELLEERLAGQRVVLRISAERHEISEFHRAFVFAFAEAVERSRLLRRGQIEDELELLSFSTAQQTTDWRLSPAVRATTRWVSQVGQSLARRALMLTVVALVLLALAFCLALLSGVPVAEDFWTWTVAGVAIAAATPVISTVISLSATHAPSVLGAAFKPGLVNRLRPRVEAADEYERVFARLVELIDDDIVVAIDDIDRLGDHDVLPALNAVRSFQLTCSRQPAFIVSADEDVIARAIKNSSPSLAGLSKDDDGVISEYLSRLFTHRQQMPPHAFADLKAYARDLLTAAKHPSLANLELHLESVVQVLIYDGVANPRHVIRLLNAFLADYRLALLREARPGVQSMAKGTVTNFPLTLARLAVLRLDFPKFYRAFSTDTELLATLEASARMGKEIFEDVSLASSLGYKDDASPDFKALQAFASRTAGWVEGVDDLLPFIYLGQDEIDRSVGSATVRKVKSMLANGLSGDFLAYVREASDGPDVSKALSLIRTTVDSLSGPELDNALSVLITAASATSDQRWLNGFAEAMAISMRRSTNPEFTAEGLSRLAGAASAPHERTLEQALLEQGISDLDWSIALIQARPNMVSALASSAEMRTRIELAIALLGTEADLHQLADVGPALLHNVNAEVRALALWTHLEILGRVDQDASPEIRATVALLARQSAPQLEIESVLPTLKQLIGSHGSVSAAIAFDVIANMRLTNAKALASLAFDVTSKSISAGKFVTGADEDYLAESKPLLLLALQNSQSWHRVVDGNKITLRQSIGNLLALSCDQFSWIDDFTEPLARALKPFPEALTPVVSAVLKSFENYATQADVQREWDLLVSMVDDLLEEDQTRLADTLAVMLVSVDDETRSAAVAKVTAFTSTKYGASSVERIIETVEGELSRSNSDPLDALVVLLSGPGVSTSRQKSAASRIANTLVPYSSTRDVSLAALMKINWGPEARPDVAAHLATSGAELMHVEVIRFAAGLLPGSAPASFQLMIEAAVKDALSADEADTAADAIGNVSGALTAEVALSTNRTLDEAIVAWLRIVDSPDEAAYAMLMEVGAKAYKDSTVHRLLTTYASTLGSIFAEQAILIAQEQISEHIDALPARAWTSVLTVLDAEATRSLADIVISAWAHGSASDSVATGPLVAAADATPSFDEHLAPHVVAAIARWTTSNPNNSAAEALGAMARSGPMLREAAHRELDRRGPRKDAAARVAFGIAKKAFGLGG